MSLSIKKLKNDDNDNDNDNDKNSYAIDFLRAVTHISIIAFHSGNYHYIIIIIYYT